MSRRHIHDWYVLDRCRDYCRICTAVKRVARDDLRAALATPDTETA